MTYDIWPRPSTRTPASILHISYHKITSPWSGDHEIYNVLPSYRTDATYQIWYNVKIGPVVLEKKTLTDDAGLTVDDGRRRTPAHGVLNMLSELLRWPKTFFSHEYFPFMEHIEYLEIVFYLNTNKILIYTFDNWWKFSFMDAQKNELVKTYWPWQSYIVSPLLTISEQ